MILITGAGGFVGQCLCSYAAGKGDIIRAAIRHSDSRLECLQDCIVINDIASSTDWSSALNGVDVVIHLAARVHVMKETLKDPMAEYRRVNVEGTRHLAMEASRAGVKRFVFISTIKVNGESTKDKPFTERDYPSPEDSYAQSKWEAEQALNEISLRTGLETVILRPPLVYGPGVKGNLLALMKYIDKGYPLPFGKIKNKRSFISLDNLVDAILISAKKPECAGKTFLVSDGQDLSTSDLVKKICIAMNRKPKIFNLPKSLFSIAGQMIPGLQSVIERITGSLTVNPSYFGQNACWKPIQTMDDGIYDMVSEYLRVK